MTEELRTVTFWNEFCGEWAFECFVRIVTTEWAQKWKDHFLGSVEYTDGSWLDIYTDLDGRLVGVEWAE